MAFAAGMSWQAVLDGLIELHSRLAGVRTAEATLGS
jgi:hypothetical protein